MFKIAFVVVVVSVFVLFIADLIDFLIDNLKRP